MSDSDFGGIEKRLDALATTHSWNLFEYEARVRERAPPGADVTLTGPAPVWLYLHIAHTLQGLARSLAYDPPVTGRSSCSNNPR